MIFSRLSRNSGFWVFLVHPTVISVLLSASVERCFVSLIRDFFCLDYKKLFVLHVIYQLFLAGQFSEKVWKQESDPCNQFIHVDKKESLNVNIINFEKVDKPEGVEKMWIRFFVKFWHFLMIFWPF